MVELEPDGIDVAALERQLAGGAKPKLAHIIPNFQNPAGYTLSAAKRERLIELAREHEFTIFGFRDLLEANALDYIQFDTNRVGGISQARKITALAESFQVPVVPHAGQLHNYHVVMASLNSPIAEFFPKVDVEVGNELFWYIFDGEPVPKDGYIDLDENVHGLGLTVNEESLKRFRIIE